MNAISYKHLDKDDDRPNQVWNGKAENSTADEIPAYLILGTLGCINKKTTSSKKKTCNTDGSQLPDHYQHIIGQ